MPDLILTRSGELDVSEVQGNTDGGIEFVDRLYLPTMRVVDAGRVIVPSDVLPSIVEAALREGLTVEDNEA